MTHRNTCYYGNIGSMIWMFLPMVMIIIMILNIITVCLFAAKRIPPVGRLLVVIVGGIDLTPGENGMALRI